MVAHDLPSQLAPAVPASKQSFVSIQAPARLRCGDAACACFCHLSRYSKTPQFLKRFVGALSFRGSCQNHSARLWEVKYWMPYWISNYNIYLLFEKTAYGAPSLGLKFQRKVPWGGEDTIIRFAFLGDTEGIKAVLESGRGSLDDVDPDYGRSGLHVGSPSFLSKPCFSPLMIFQVCGPEESCQSVSTPVASRSGQIYRRRNKHVSSIASSLMMKQCAHEGVESKGRRPRKHGSTYSATEDPRKHSNSLRFSFPPTTSTPGGFLPCTRLYWLSRAFA